MRSKTVKSWDTAARAYKMGRSIRLGLSRPETADWLRTADFPLKPRSARALGKALIQMAGEIEEGK